MGLNISAAQQSIKDIESSGGNYSALGPVTSSGDRAYGAYQVMGANIPSWTQQATGTAETPSQFLNDPSTQDAVFDQQFGNSYNKYGDVGDAASVWFTGKPFSSGTAGLSDGITSNNSYVNQAVSGYNNYSANGSSNDNTSASAGGVSTDEASGEDSQYGYASANPTPQTFSQTNIGTQSSASNAFSPGAASGNDTADAGLNPATVPIAITTSQKAQDQTANANTAATNKANTADTNVASGTLANFYNGAHAALGDTLFRVALVAIGTVMLLGALFIIAAEEGVAPDPRKMLKGATAFL